MSAPHTSHDLHADHESDEHHHAPEPWIDRWWPLLIIIFGLIFTLCLTLYRPQHEWSLIVPAPPQSAIQSAVLV